MVNVGEKAPDFELKDQHEKMVKLSSFKGKKVLLAFFPFAFSPVCTTEHNCFRDDMNKFNVKGVEVMGISVDSTWSNKAFADSLGIDYPLLSDFGKEVAKMYGVLRKEGFSDRAYFLVDEKGMIKYKHVMASPGTRLDNKELLKAMG